MSASPFDIDAPDWCYTNDDGIWCSFCGECLLPAHHIDDDSAAPEHCRSCGAPDDAEAMADYFT